MTDQQKVVFADGGHSGNDGLAAYVNEHDDMADTLQYVGRVHHLGSLVQQAVDEGPAASEDPSFQARAEARWYLYEAKSHSDGSKFLVFVLTDNMDNVSEVDWGYCKQGLNGSVDCPSILASVQH